MTTRGAALPVALRNFSAHSVFATILPPKPSSSSCSFFQRLTHAVALCGSWAIVTEDCPRGPELSVGHAQQQ
jgi:hypothetical protein